MERNLPCPTCGKDVLVKDVWDCGDIACPHCGKVSTVFIDESYDPESGEESVWFYLEAQESNS